MLTKENYTKLYKDYQEGIMPWYTFFSWLGEELRLNADILPLKVRNALKKVREGKVNPAEFHSIVVNTKLEDWESKHLILKQRAESFGISFPVSFTVCMLQVYARQLGFELENKANSNEKV